MNSRVVTEDLIKSAKLIRDKFRALKRGRFIDQEQRLEMLKPITEPLQKLSNKTEENIVVAAPSQVVRYGTPSKIPALQTRPPPTTLNFGILAAKYLSNYMANRKITDTTYGLRKIDEDSNKFYIGSEVVEIANDDIIIGDVVYKGTEGLWQLLTLKRPEKYTENDLTQYKEILIKTNAHKKSYNPDSQISSNPGTKYMDIIGPLFSKSGEGLREVTNNKIDHVYWNNPNELVNRLRLLILSREAGNTGVGNEIDSILEELLEEQIIS